VIILDTDHITILRRGFDPEHAMLAARMAASVDQSFVTTVITLEEQLRGWLGLLRRRRDVQHQLFPYKELISVVDFFSRIEIRPFTAPAADQFVALRAQKVRIGTMDLKIASIALAEDALLQSANRGDFQQVPNLQVEDWIH
jgi:tRNA(fMet)-specific endonuclease VapC